MKVNFSKLAAALAAVIGLMAVFAGGPVILGRDPGYYVIGWVPVYNVAIGLVSLFVSAILLWRRSRWAWPAAWATLALHALVLFVLLTAYREVVAVESLAAMAVRITVWGGILALLWLGARANAKPGIPTTG